MVQPIPHKNSNRIGTIVLSTSDQRLGRSISFPKLSHESVLRFVWRQQKYSTTASEIIAHAGEAGNEDNSGMIPKATKSLGSFTFAGRVLGNS